MKKILATAILATLIGAIGCTDTDGNGPVNLPGNNSGNEPGQGEITTDEPNQVTVGQPLPAWTEGCLDIHHITAGYQHTNTQYEATQEFHLLIREFICKDININ